MSILPGLSSSVWLKFWRQISATADASTHLLSLMSYAPAAGRGTTSSWRPEVEPSLYLGLIRCFGGAYGFWGSMGAVALTVTLYQPSGAPSLVADINR